MRRKNKKVICKNCKHLLYSPPIVQKVLNDPRPFFCMRNVWRDIEDPAVFEIPRFCRKYTKNDEDDKYFVLEQEPLKALKRVKRVKMVRAKKKLMRRVKPKNIIRKQINLFDV